MHCVTSKTPLAREYAAEDMSQARGPRGRRPRSRGRASGTRSGRTRAPSSRPPSCQAKLVINKTLTTDRTRHYCDKGSECTAKDMNTLVCDMGNGSRPGDIQWSAETGKKVDCIADPRGDIHHGQGALVQPGAQDGGLPRVRQHGGRRDGLEQQDLRRQAHGRVLVRHGGADLVLRGHYRLHRVPCAGRTGTTSGSTTT